LAITWAIKKCHLFLAGLEHFTVITDHHRLKPILNNHRLDEIEHPRLQRLRMKIMGYNFTADWLKGAHNSAPDALSSYPLSRPAEKEQLAETDLDDELYDPWQQTPCLFACKKSKKDPQMTRNTAS